MRLHYIQHVPFEGLANIESWAKSRNWEITGTHIYRMEKLPDLDDLDWLVVMGGPMNIYEENEYPWLAAEKNFIREAVERDKIVLGICLGAQLIAGVLGGKVFRNRYREIGWYPVTMRPEARSCVPFRGFPDEFMAFHWHGDTFSLPPGASMVAQSNACPAQAFCLNGGRVLGLQFHLESSPSSIGALIENCSDELVDAQYVQSAEEIMGNQEHFPGIHKTMLMMLENMTEFL